MTFVTHSGRFHADEITAYAILLLTGEVNKFIRLLDTDAYEKKKNHIVGDILRKHEPNNGYFDHHQETITDANDRVLATAGLIWKHYGADAIVRVLGDVSPAIQETIFKEVEKYILTPIDSNDADKKYKVESYGTIGQIESLTLMTCIRFLNSPNKTQANQNPKFNQAAKFIKMIISSFIENTYESIVQLEQATEHLKKYYNNEILYVPMFLTSRSTATLFNDHPEANFIILNSDHPGNKFALLARQNERVCVVPIKRFNGFTGFIHESRWIAGGNDAMELVTLAISSINHHEKMNETRSDIE